MSTARPPRTALRATLLFLLFKSSLADQTCYWPSGKTPTSSQPKQVPCNTTTDDAVTCCGDGHACLSNGLCYGGDVGLTYRGSCTDQRWSSPNCPIYCNDENPDKWSNLFVDTDPYQWYCAEQTGTTFGSTASTFTYPSGTLVNIVHAGATAASSSPTTSTSEQSSRTSSSGGTKNSKPSATPTSSPLQAVATATVTTSPNSNSNSKTAVAIGAGIGVPLGILAFALIGFLFWRKGKGKASDHQAAPPYSGSDDDKSQGRMLQQGQYGRASMREQWRQEMSGEPGAVEAPGGKSWMTPEMHVRHELGAR